ncbi:hypothetical protein [Streptomyces sp. NPDC048191]|uniref:hypothetical protein n=1 Tax=Streptomyces sp. NPDC048191 TaxID=3155484 RepID=UPI0033FF6FA3
MNAFNQHPSRVFRDRELHELLDMPTDEASVNITRSRLGRLTRQGFLTQPGRGRYQKRTTQTRRPPGCRPPTHRGITLVGATKPKRVKQTPKP